MSNEVVHQFRPVAPSGGRDAEVSALLHEREEAQAAGRARFVFVRGPRGVGKSHLIDRLSRELAAQGVPVFEGGSCREARRTWGVFGPLVGELLSWAGRSGVPEARLAALARSVEPLRAGLSGGALEAQRLALYDGVCELLALAGRAAPVVVLPDLDAADASSLELVRYLAAALSVPEARAGGLFVLTLRDDAALPAVLSDVLAHVPGRTLPLKGLDLDGLRAFLSQPEVAQRLLDATGGNPEVLGALLDTPAQPVDFFLARWARLPVAQRSVAEALSASPDALTVDVLAAALGDEVSQVAAALDALQVERVVLARVVDGRPAWRLARAGEKLAVLACLSVERTAQLKRALGTALAGVGLLQPAAQLLLEVDPAAAAPVAAAAAQELVARGALEDADALLERLVPVVPAPERAGLVAQHATVLVALGRYARAARRFLELARRTDGTPQAAARLDAARMLVKRGRAARALVVLDACEALVPRAAKAVRAEALLVSGDPSGAAALCRAALAQEAADEVAVALLNVLGKALLVQGQAEAAEETFRQNVATAQALGRTHDAAIAHLNEGVAAFKRGGRERAMACWAATGEASRPARAQALANLGSAYAESGDFELALDHLGRALRAFSRFAGSREVSMAANNLARLHHFLGDLDRAGELGQHALDRATVLGEAYLVAAAKLTLGAVALDGRESAPAVRLLDEARQAFEKVGNDGFAALAAALKARAHLDAGERAQAEAEVSRRCVDKGEALLPAALVEAQLVKGELALKLGDLRSAGRAAARLRELLLERPDLDAPIRTYFLMGQLKQAASDTQGAQAEFQRAGRLLDELAQRVPPVRREAFLSVPRRAQVVAAVEPELRLPRALATLAARPRVEQRYGLVGSSEALQRLLRQLEPLGRSNATVLVRGESGTGKELMAEALHDLSPRKHMPLVKVNCAAMVEDLLLSELFGHEKGAFTGAVRERKGRFELADGGTIFLDEIGDISPKAQVALLRVLQEREFDRVGGSKTIKVDVRVICATNRDLEGAIAQGRFRADLYYRLKGVMLELPPLRDRPEDLQVLSQHFLDRVAKERSEAPRQLTEDALALLARHSWPGNVRELENVICAASIFAEGPSIGPDAFSHITELRALAAEPSEVDPAVAPELVPAPRPAAAAAREQAAAPLDFYELARQRGLGLKELRHEVEMQCIARALADAGGNISEAARLLQMKRSRLSQIVNAEPSLKEVARGED